MTDDVQPPASCRGSEVLEARLAACADELRRATADADALIARSTAQFGQCRRLARVIDQHEQASRLLLVTARTAQVEVARLAGILAERDRQAAELEARIANHEAEYRRLTRLVADRAREILELHIALGR